MTSSPPPQLAYQELPLARIEQTHLPPEAFPLAWPIVLWAPISVPPPPDELPVPTPYLRFNAWVFGLGSWSLMLRALPVFAVGTAGIIALASGGMEVLEVSLASIGLLAAVVAHIVTGAVIINRRPLGKGRVIVPLPLSDCVNVLTEYCLELGYGAPEILHEAHYNWITELQPNKSLQQAPMLVVRMAATYFGMEVIVAALSAAGWLTYVHPLGAQYTRSLLEAFVLSAQLARQHEAKHSGVHGS